MSWFLRYTSHLGYFPPELRPQFAATVGSDDPVAHIEYASSIGMAGVLYPWAAERPDTEVRAVRDALTSTGLGIGCLVGVPLAATFGGPWADRSPNGRSTLEQYVVTAAKTATLLGSSTLAAIVTADPSRDGDAQVEAQLDDAAANVRDMAGVAADHGLTLAVEPMCVLPGMLVNSTQRAAALLDRADHPSTGLIFDTGHVASMGEDILTTFADVFDRIAVLQLVDDPGRVEPGAGNLPLVELAADANRRGYSGLIDLEHDWSTPDAAGEQAGLDRVRAFDDAVRSAVTGLSSNEAG
ncbi:sugar phosphate isomerase/epimerase [Mycobacterium sp. DBP42]|jgi:hydroxypyruvate isomerase|uniref:sugar phosphate isomerase/epimerase family protein n=1 Tax=Mycobacterium sp. DBP42 TaxID=2545267 RepID=UPI00110D0C53|nr:sugar phosphate isomerase/epimerase family protein [Mycobacterium sp. DBP42]TMS52460.1 TIM barrel protein [Mycobacterium sp. DBP42]